MVLDTTVSRFDPTRFFPMGFLKRTDVYHLGRIIKETVRSITPAVETFREFCGWTITCMDQERICWSSNELKEQTIFAYFNVVFLDNFSQLQFSVLSKIKEFNFVRNSNLLRNPECDWSILWFLCSILNFDLCRTLYEESLLI